MNNSATQGGASACSGTIQLADPGIGGNSAWGALAVNITVANTGPGPAFLRVRPVGSTNTTSFLNWSTAGSQVTNAGIVQLADVALNGQFEMLASSSTDVIIDVFGAFGRTNQMTCSNVFNTTATTLNPGSFVFLNDTDIVACPAGAVAVGFVWHYLTGSGGMAPWENQPGDSNGGLGFTHVPPAPGNAGSAITFNPGRRCCSIPNVTQ